MRIVFFATGSFAYPILRGLSQEREEVLYLVTQPDRPAGRGLKVSTLSLKRVAQGLGIKVLQPNDLKDASFHKALQDSAAEVFIVVSYGKILPAELLRIPSRISFNIHASLLPKYRGAAPINWTLINGEKETGVTFIRMTPQMDAGSIIYQQAIPVDMQDDAITLSQKLSSLAAGACPHVLQQARDDALSFQPQDESRVTLAPKLKKEDGLIDWNLTSQQIYDRIRGLLPWPVAYSFYRGKRLLIRKAIAREEKGASPGAVVEVGGEGLAVSTGRGLLQILELQVEGKRVMSAQEFLSGHPIEKGEILGLLRT